MLLVLGLGFRGSYNRRVALPLGIWGIHLVVASASDSLG